MLQDIANKIKKLNSRKIYSPLEIYEQGLIFSDNGQPALKKIYRLIQRGEIPAFNNGTEQRPKYLIEGKHLRVYLKRRYNLK